MNMEENITITGLEAEITNVTVSLSFLLASGNSCPYISDDLNEDTISVLVRLITEKKGMC